jgi:uncharacterized membrane protein
MDQVIHTVIIIHIAAGALSLLFGMIAFFLRKNTPKHKPIGRIYFWCMTLIFITGIFLSLARALVFFFLIAVFSYYSAIVAYRSLRLKNLHKGQKPLLIDWMIQGIAGLSFLGMIGFALVVYFNRHSVNALVPFVFGAFGLSGVYRKKPIIGYHHM